MFVLPDDLRSEVERRAARGDAISADDSLALLQKASMQFVVERVKAKSLYAEAAKNRQQQSSSVAATTADSSSTTSADTLALSDDTGQYCAGFQTAAGAAAAKERAEAASGSAAGGLRSTDEQAAARYAQTWKRTYGDVLADRLVAAARGKRRHRHAACARRLAEACRAVHRAATAVAAASGLANATPKRIHELIVIHIGLPTFQVCFFLLLFFIVILTEHSQNEVIVCLERAYY